MTPPLRTARAGMMIGGSVVAVAIVLGLFTDAFVEPRLVFRLTLLNLVSNVALLIFLLVGQVFPSWSSGYPPKQRYQLAVIVVAAVSTSSALLIVTLNNRLRTTSIQELRLASRESSAGVSDVSGRLPTFPWPPPATSARTVLPRRFFDRARTLGDVNQALYDALFDNGYVETSYFIVPRGFALVTRLEQIERNGASRPLPERWSVEKPLFTPFSLSEYVRLLFTAPAGRYRLIVFIVTDVPFPQSSDEVTRSEAIDWLQKGVNVFPGFIAEMTHTAEYNTTALIYDFVQRGQGAQLMMPSDIDAQTHLVRAKLWGSLTQKPAVPLSPAEVKLQWQCHSDLDLSVSPLQEPSWLNGGREKDVTAGPGTEIVRIAKTHEPITIEVRYYDGIGPCPFELEISANSSSKRLSGKLNAPGDKEVFNDALRR